MLDDGYNDLHLGKMNLMLKGQMRIHGLYYHLLMIRVQIHSRDVCGDLSWQLILLGGDMIRVSL